LGLDVGQAYPEHGPQIPTIVYGVNNSTGQVEGRPAIGKGVDFFSDNNSQPAASPRGRSGSLDFVDGGAAAEKTRPLGFVPIGNPVDFIALDPVARPVPNSDTADKRKLRNGSAIFG
jgi:hypothetical protein